MIDKIKNNEEKGSLLREGGVGIVFRNAEDGDIWRKAEDGAGVRWTPLRQSAEAPTEPAGETVPYGVILDCIYHSDLV